ncbi:MAG: c-type cytochrome [Chromatiales bacterium]|nr:c-type cytochrome [Chromatiales bacterium]
MNEAEVVAVAQFYAALPAPAALEPQPDETLMKAGERLAQIGNWSKGVPACYQCHGPDGQGVAAHFPAIAPQSATYVANQLRDWKSGSRHNDPASLMKAVAERLSEDEITAVAAYLASRNAPGAR